MHIIDNADEIGPVFRQLVAAHGATLRELADACGVHGSSLSEWQTGRHVPQLDKFMAALNAMGWRLAIVEADK